MARGPDLDRTDHMSPHSHVVTQLMFDYERLPQEEMRALAADLPAKVLRWIGMHHPDNRSRRLFYELTGVPIGEETVLNSGLILYDEYRGLVRFGRRVAVASGVTIVAASGPNNSRLAAIPHVRDRLTVTAAVEVRDDAWIGAQAVILPGVVVGEGCVVGAGAVVHRSTDPYSVVAGVPARTLRRLRP
jgi:maltose O-acetyltransferase